MTLKMDQALAELSKLPVPEQELAAEAILDFVARDRRLTLTDEQAAEVRRRLSEAEPITLGLATVRDRLARLGI